MKNCSLTYIHINACLDTDAHMHRHTPRHSFTHKARHMDAHPHKDVCHSAGAPWLGSRVRVRSECKNRAVCLSDHTVGAS